HRQPHFSARDTTRIFAYSPSDGLVSFRWDGTDVKHVLRIGGATGVGSPPPAGQDEHERNPIELENNPGVGAVTLIRLSPNGERAVAQAGMDLYVVSVPTLAGANPSVTLGDPSTAAFPVRRLTDIGGQF